VRRSGIAVALALAVAGCAGRDEPLPPPAVTSTPAVPAITPIPAPHLACLAQVERGVGASEPRALRHAMPRFPKLGPRTRVMTTTWVGVAEIDLDGSVTRVRTIRRLKLDPPWPEFEDAFPAAIRQWKYEPRCVDGQPVKTKLTISANIDF
jgi:hypothetical protein